MLIKFTYYAQNYTLPSYEDHTEENIAAALQDVLKNWQLSSENLVLLPLIMLRTMLLRLIL